MMNQSLSKVRTRKRKTQLQIENQLLEIEHRIYQGHTDKEIIEELNIKERTFYYYKNKIYQMSGSIQAKKTEEMMAFELQILKDRLTLLFRHLYLKLESPNTKLGQVAKIADTAQQIATNIYKLEFEGLRGLSDMKNFANKAAEQ
jgi:hypothetical protein